MIDFKLNLLIKTSVYYLKLSRIFSLLSLSKSIKIMELKRRSVNSDTKVDEKLRNTI